MFKITKLILLVILLINTVLLISCGSIPNEAGNKTFSNKTTSESLPSYPIKLNVAIPLLTNNLLKKVKNKQNIWGKKNILLEPFIFIEVPPSEIEIDTSKSVEVTNKIKEMIFKEWKKNFSKKINMINPQIKSNNIDYLLTGIIRHEPHEDFSCSKYSIEAFIKDLKTDEIVAKSKIWISKSENWSDIFLPSDYLRKAIAKIESKGKKGAGFIIAKDQGMKELYIITAAHVTHPNRHPKITFYSRENTKFKSTVIEAQRGEIDGRKIGSTVLEVNTLEVNKMQDTIFDELPHFYLESCDPVERQVFYTYVFGGKADWAADNLFFSKKLQDRYMFSNGMIDEGSSGAPIIKPNSMIVCAMIQEVDNKAVYAIPTNNILSFLEGIPDGKRIIKLMRTPKCKFLRKKRALLDSSHFEDNEATYLKTQCKDIF